MPGMKQHARYGNEKEPLCSINLSKIVMLSMEISSKTSLEMG